MDFKKDYINYVLNNVVNMNYPVLMGYDDTQLSFEVLYVKKILNKIIQTDDIVKTTFLVGKTAGLEQLFKYILYISDKIDKSQITIFNLKDNFDYDVQNVKNIIAKVDEFLNKSKLSKSEKVKHEQIPIREHEEKKAGTIKIDIEREKEIITPHPLTEFIEERDSISIESMDEEEQGMTLIENVNAGNKENEVMEIADIGSEEEEIKNEPEQKYIEDNESAAHEEVERQENEIFEESKVEGTSPVDKDKTEVKEGVDIPADAVIKKEDIELEFEVKEPVLNEGSSSSSGHVKEDTPSNEAYLKFENRFFEEIKILEKHFYYISRECKREPISKLNDKILQSCTEIIEISSEFSDLTHQLSFDLTADIFYTINLLFTKTLQNPSLLTYDRIKLLESSLALVTSLIKGEDYLNYDIVVDKIEKLKSELSRTPEKEIPKEKKVEDKIQEVERTIPKSEISVKIEPEIPLEKEGVKKTEQVLETEMQNETDKDKIPFEQFIKSGHAEIENVVFKMKHFVKEFEKTFISLGNIEGEFSKFEALEKIDELNNSLRMIAKISSSVEMIDVLKLSEVTYIFLKYLKDYRMDLLDSEIQQIIKYVIFTFKMLLTDRKPEDFDILVQYLNNPVKIFTDS